MSGVLAVVRAVAERAEPVVRRHLPRVVAGLLAFGLAVANVPQASSAPASEDGTRTELVRALAQPSASTFAGSRTPGREGVEASALALVASVGGLESGPGGGLAAWVRGGGALVPPDRCPPDDLVVSWRPPAEGLARVGAYVAPLGPPPTDATAAVNGIVECRSSSYAFLGFEAARRAGRWWLTAVPSLEDEGGEPLLEGEAEAVGATPATAPGDLASDGGAAVLPPPSAWSGAPLEPLAPYVAQTTCDPVAKAGVLGFRDLLLEAFPGSRNLGIGRVCDAEGVSEHKEGRAFDWGVSVDDPGERAAAESVLAWMLGPDPETGEPFAIARRLGVMYVIWDGRIWSAFRASDGWRPYVGVSQHRDHVHVSFDWPGALAQTSFWAGGRARPAGSDVPDLPLLPVGPPAAPPTAGLFPGLPLPAVPLPGFPAPSAADASEPPPETTTTTGPPPSTTTTSTTTTTTTTSTTTTTTTAPAPTLLPPPPTIRLGSG